MDDVRANAAWIVIMSVLVPGAVLLWASSTALSAGGVAEVT